MSETQILIDHLGTLSYVGIFGVALLSNVIIPVPEEIVLLAFGYLAGTGKVNGFILVPIVIAGLLTSDLIMYTLSRRGSRIITFFYNKFFARRLETKRAWIEANIEKVIFCSRFLLQLRFLGPCIAGQLKVPLGKFIFWELAALVIYVPLLIWLGSYFRNRVEDIISGVGMVHNVILIAVGVLLVIGLSRYLERWMLRAQGRPEVPKK